MNKDNLQEKQGSNSSLEIAAKDMDFLQTVMAKVNISDLN